MTTSSESSGKLAALLEEAADLTGRAARAAAAGELEEMRRLETQSAELRRRAQRTSRSIEHARVGRDAGSRISARAQAITALSEMDVPAPAREIAAYHAARFGQTLDVRALASIRRDERKAWERSQGTHPVYLAPALETRFFRPVRGPMTLSTWPMEKRLIGSSSARIDHLRLAIRIAEMADKLSGTVAAEALGKLVWRYAGSIPGAAQPGKSVEPAIIAAAARTELELVASQDDKDRAAGAQRALAQLSDEQQLWGHEHGLQLVVESGAR